jgi:TRAP transporter solute receptor, dctP family
MVIKKIIAGVLAGVTAFSLTACGAPRFTVNDAGEKVFNLKLGHNMAEDHTVHIVLSEFVENVKEKSHGTINITIFPNGTLGSETDMIAQIQGQALDMAKVSASTLGNFSKLYNAYAVPYVFNDKEHYFGVMDSDIAKEVYESTETDGFRGLTWLDSGARSFYTVKKPIRKPEDLKGLKIRTMDSKMAIDMMKALGGSATVMGYSDIYTGLQQGVIDGAENNVTAMRDHGEVAHYYSYDEHTRIPDIIVMSEKIWDEMSDEQREIMNECARDASQEYIGKWAEFENKVVDKAKNEFGVEFVTDVDKAAFQKACKPIYDALKTEQPEVYNIVEKIQNFKVQK